jgi:hypothetical protein
MPLNKEGVELLKADLRADAKHYNQGTFGTTTAECGTECCMAGLCLRRSLGPIMFNQRVKHTEVGSEHAACAAYALLQRDCLTVAMAQLGIIAMRCYGITSPDCPPIFDIVDVWPAALRGRYDKASQLHDHAAMAEVACDALDSIDEYGRFTRQALQQSVAVRLTQAQSTKEVS